MSAADFRLSNARRINKNMLIGAFDLEMPSGLKVNGVMLFEKDGKRWVGFSSREWLKQDGTKQYTPLIEFASPEVRERFQNAVVPLAVEALL